MMMMMMMIITIFSIFLLIFHYLTEPIQNHIRFLIPKNEIGRSAVLVPMIWREKMRLSIGRYLTGTLPLLESSHPSFALNLDLITLIRMTR